MIPPLILLFGVEDPTPVVWSMGLGFSEMAHILALRFVRPHRRVLQVRGDPGRPHAVRRNARSERRVLDFHDQSFFFFSLGPALQGTIAAQGVVGRGK